MKNLNELKSLIIELSGFRYFKCRHADFFAFIFVEGVRIIDIDGKRFGFNAYADLYKTIRRYCGI